MSCRSRAISLRSCSRLGGFVADLTVAIVSRPISNGPPGSASEMAIPPTNGARRILIHSSSGNASFVVTVPPLVRLVSDLLEPTAARRDKGHPRGVIVEVRDRMRVRSSGARTRIRSRGNGRSGGTGSPSPRIGGLARDWVPTIYCVTYMSAYGHEVNGAQK